MYVYVCVCLCEYPHVQKGVNRDQEIAPRELRSQGSCEPPDLSARNWIPVISKNKWS